MTQSEERRRLLPESAPVKIMEKVSHMVVVDNWPGRIGIGMGKSIESSPFMVGDYSFRIELYPDGCNEESHSKKYISLYIKNDSPKAAQLVYDLEIIDRKGNMLYGHSSFKVRETYHHVDTCLPGSLLGYFDYIKHSFISEYYGPNHSILIRATIGLVHDHHHEQLPIAKSAISSSPSSSSSSVERHRCIIFQVGDLRFFEFESVITRECPALISDYYPQSNHIVVISDVDPEVFKAVLFFLSYKGIHSVDKRPITDFNGVFALKILALADKLHLKFLTIQICNYLALTGNLHVLYRYSGISHTVKELWNKVSSWELPHKMKAADGDEAALAFLEKFDRLSVIRPRS